jgi:hypothetical protein
VSIGTPGGPSPYTVTELVLRVGLPSRSESRDAGQLKTYWGPLGQNLPIDPNRIDDQLVESWKAQRVALLEARDTFLGLILGSRPGDRVGGVDHATPISAPGADVKTDRKLLNFLGRVYEFFDFGSPADLQPDPRRHPPQLYRYRAPQLSMVHHSAMRYVASLHTPGPAHENVGAVWVDVAPTRGRSAGLVAIICDEHILGGEMFHTAVAATMFHASEAPFTRHDVGDARVRRRALSPPDVGVDRLVDTVAHEFGHTFNLDDEYETSGGDDIGSRQPASKDFDTDNVTRFVAIWRHAPPGGPPPYPDREIDHTKVKWLKVLRPVFASVLLRDSEVPASGVVRLTVDRNDAAQWQQAHRINALAFVQIAAGPGKHLPPVVHRDIPIAAADDDGHVDLTLSGPTFPKGSMVFLARRMLDGTPMSLAQPEVLTHLAATHLPLNANTDTSQPTKAFDVPVPIAGLRLPYNEYRVIGVYEGAATWAGSIYRAAGACKMRTTAGAGAEGEFCYVCKYLIVNRVDPSMHALLDAKHYPK